MSDYLKKLFIDEAKAVLFKGSITNSSGGSTDTSDGEIATDEEVDNVIDDVFGETESGDDTSTDSGEVDEDNIATDEEVEDVIDDVFG